jgi:protein TonB
MRAPLRIRIGANVQAHNLLYKPEPVYPPLARTARVQGTVRFNVVIEKDGHVRDAELVSGHPLLIPSAVDAVKQYVYKPTLLNGQPVEVITMVEVEFTLAN